MIDAVAAPWILLHLPSDETLERITVEDRELGVPPEDRAGADDPCCTELVEVVAEGLVPDA